MGLKWVPKWCPNGRPTVANQTPLWLATVGGAKMEPKWSPGGAIRRPHALCVECELLGCSAGGPEETQLRNKKLHGLRPWILEISCHLNKKFETLPTFWRFLNILTELRPSS